MIFALAGNQNCGKTTLFNALTGSNQHVGNFPGVTVDQKSGEVREHKECTVVDLPGIYSLRTYTQEEIVTRDYILNQKPDGIINIVDATNIERNLYLTLQLLELRVPMVLALNMMDEVRANGGTIDVQKLSDDLGIPVVPITAAKGEGVSELMDRAVETAKNRVLPKVYDFCAANSPVHRCVHAVVHLIEDHAERLGLPPRFCATKLIEGDRDMADRLVLDQNERELLEHCIVQMETENGLDRNASLADMRYTFIEQVTADAVVKCHESKEHKRSVAWDRVLTGKYTALPVFFGVMLLIFWLTFEVIGQGLSDLLALGIDYVTAGVDGALTAYGINPVVHSLVIDGIFAGVGSVLSFLPTIVILFFFLSILEDTGYMARVAFVMDKLLRRIGLSGRSFVPMLVGFGCSVPAIMSARTIKNVNERNNTIILTPFIPCSAKLPLFAFFTTAVFNGSALSATSMYFVGIFSVVAGGLILKVFKRRKTTVRDTFIMELPSYRLPKASNVLKEMWERGKAFLLRASTVILAASIVLWFLQSFDYKFAYGVSPDRSILAEMGRLLAPVFKPLGWGNWQTAVATLTGLAAKETVVTTLNILGVDGTMFTPLSAYSFMTFNLLAAPCISAIAASFRELHSAKTGWFAIAFQICFAYVVSLVIYQAGILYAKNNMVFWSVVGTLAAAVFLYTGIKLLIKHRGCNMECDHCPKNKNCKR